MVALNNDGELTGPLLAQAAAGIAEAAAAPGPRGRMRLLAVLRAVRGDTLVITPTGAMDLLARLHLEFLVDPLDLGLRRIVLTGEIASPGTAAHLAAEFDAEVTELYTDPVFGLPVAHGTAHAGAARAVRAGPAHHGRAGRTSGRPRGDRAHPDLAPAARARRDPHRAGVDRGRARPHGRRSRAGPRPLARRCPGSPQALARIDGIATGS